MNQWSMTYIKNNRRKSSTIEHVRGTIRKDDKKQNRSAFHLLLIEHNGGPFMGLQPQITTPLIDYLTI